MFDIGKRSKEEPERPYKYEPERPDPPVYQPLQPARFMAGMPNLASHLPALNGVNRPMLPPMETASRYVPELAELLEEVGAAHTAAFRAAQEWLNAQTGEGFKHALAADAAWVEPWIEKGEDPPDDDGPLLAHLVAGIPQAFARAWHASVAADLADSRARKYGASDAVRKPLDEVTDVLALQIQDHLERARDHKDKRAYEDAIDICAEWASASSLWEWSADTSKAFRPRQARSYPRYLGILEHEAAVNLGETRHVIPIEALEDPMAPPSTMFPSRQSAALQVIGDGATHWGSQGPPGRLQQWRARRKGE